MNLMDFTKTSVCEFTLYNFFISITVDGTPGKNSSVCGSQVVILIALLRNGVSMGLH